MKNLSEKIKVLKEVQKEKNTISKYSHHLEEKHCQSSGYEPIASINLPRGKYLLTLNFLLKTGAGGIYLYFKQGQHLMNYNGMYVADYNHFIPQTIRKIYTVK